MQTPAILNLNSTAPQQTAAKPSDGGAKDTSFDQMLSRQLAEKRAASNAQEAQKTNKTEKSNDAKRSENAAPKKTAAPSDATAAPKEAAKETEKTVAESASDAPSPTDVLALAAQGLMLQDASAKASSQTDIDTDASLDDIDAEKFSSGRSEALPEQSKGKADPRQASFERVLASADKATGLQNAAVAVQSAGDGKAFEKLSGLADAKTQDVTALNGTTSTAQQSPIDLSKVSANPADRLTARVGTPAWDQALGQKVVWMVNGSQQSASLTLNPPDLGPLKVVLNVSNGQADASFYAAHPETRQALESAMQKLRDMMTEAGVELGQTSVSAGMPDQHNRPGEHGAQHAGRGLNSDDASVSASLPVGSSTQVLQSGQGLVDTFA